MCCSIDYLSGFAQQFSSWMLALVTIERMIAVCWPHLAKFYCTKSKATISIGIVGICLTLLNCHVLWTSRVMPMRLNHKNYYCSATDKHFDFVHKTWPLIHLMAYFFIPFVIIIGGNVCIIVSLVKSRNHLREMRSDSRRTDQQFVHMTIVLILICTVFFITVSPIAIHRTLKKRFGDTTKSLDPLRVVRMWILSHVFHTISFANHGLNFLLYMITGSTFRKELSSAG